MAFNQRGAFSGAAAGAGIGTAINPGLGTAIGAGVGLLAGGFMDEPSGPNIDISAELARIDALYAQARQQGSAAITQDFQAQRGELAQSQATRGILRSGVSKLGLARLGAARQQALAQFNAQLSAAQAGQSSSILNALLGRKSALDESAFNRRSASTNQLIGVGAGALGSYLQSRRGGVAPQQGGGYNFFGSNMVAPQSPPSGQSFYQNEFGRGPFVQPGGLAGNWTGEGFR